MNELSTVETPSGLSSSLTTAQQALAEATSDFERIRIRDFSQAIAAAAEILNHQDVQIQASILVCNAERAIAKANPPKARGGDRRSKHFQSPSQRDFDSETEHLIPAKTVQTIRQLHAKLTDQQYEAKIQEAIENQTPLTRASLNSSNAAMNNANANHEWYTPGEYIDLVRAVLGNIDLDPASSEAANKVVQADKIFTEVEDGLSQAWHGRVYLNPPYTRHIVTAFVDKLISEIADGNVSEAILLVYSITDANWYHQALKSTDALLFTDQRLKFWNANQIQRGHYGQSIFYWGGNAGKFRETFKAKGTVISLN